MGLASEWRDIRYLIVLSKRRTFTIVLPGMSKQATRDAMNEILQAFIIRLAWVSFSEFLRLFEYMFVENQHNGRYSTEEGE